MGEAEKIGCSLPVIDLTNDNASSNSRATQYLDLTGSEDKGNRSPELIDLTDDQHASNIPVIDLTGDDDFLDYRIPIIDLTDDVQDIVHQTQYIDLTCDDASTSSKHTIQNLNVGGTDYGDTNRSTKLIDFIDDIQDFNDNTPVIDFTSDNHQFQNDRIQDIDMTDITLDITHRLQNVDLAHGKQQHKNQCIPTTDLTNHRYQNIDRIPPLTDLTSDKDCNNDRPVNDLIRNYKVIGKPVEDGEMYDLSSNNSTSFQNDVIENIFRIPTVNLSYKVTENDDFKCNETSSMDLMHMGSISPMQKFHRRNEILGNHPQTNNFQSRNETILTNHPLTSHFEGRKEAVLSNELTQNFEKRNLSPGNSKKISQNKSFDVMKPAHHPIPFRHSLGRSTVNTSKNVPIEYIEDSEDQSHTLTVASIIRRKKSEPSGDISKHNLLSSSEPSASREDTFLFDDFKGIFWNFWIFLLLIFVGLYYWFLNVGF